jgi:hypothetical protein
VEQSVDGGSSYLRVSNDGNLNWEGTASGSVAGDGSGLTGLDADNITQGTLEEARID